jgi:hypothetical protein
MSQMELVNDHSLPTAYGMLAVKRKEYIATPVFSMLDTHMLSTHTAPFLPSAFLTEEIMDSLIAHEAQLSNLFPNFLNSSSTTFSLMDLPGVAIKDFHPTPCVWTSPFPWSDANDSQQRIMGYTWKSLRHASLGIFLSTAHLHGCSVASVFTKKMAPLANFETSTEYLTMTEKALKSLDIIVGSVPYILNIDRETAHYNPHEPTGGYDFSWCFFLIPFLAALESPFVTETQRECLLSATKYISQEKGIQQAEAFLHCYQSWREESRY